MTSFVTALPYCHLEKWSENWELCPIPTSLPVASHVYACIIYNLLYWHIYHMDGLYVLKVKGLAIQLCLCDPMDCSLPDSSVGFWDSPGKNIGAVCHFLLQRIFQTQESNPGIAQYRLFFFFLPSKPLGKPRSNTEIGIIHTYYSDVYFILYNRYRSYLFFYVVKFIFSFPFLA